MKGHELNLYCIKKTAGARARTPCTFVPCDFDMHPPPSSLPGLPLVRDPLDARYTDVLPSTIPGAGEGLFARKDVEAYTVVSVFSGLTMSKEEFMERKGTKSGPGCSELVTLSINAIGLDPGQVILKSTQAKLLALPGGGHPLQCGVHCLQWTQVEP